MGAETTWSIYKGKTAKDAYGSAVDQARYECGNGGYTGTIAESRGYVEIRPRTRYAAEKAANTLMYDGMVDGTRVQKWEHSVMIPLIPSVAERTIVLPLDVTKISTERAKWSDPDPWLVAAEQAVKAKLRKDEHIVSLKYVRKTERPWYYEQADDATKKAIDLCKRTLGTDVRRTTGERKTLWAVVKGKRASALHITNDLDTAKAYAKQEAADSALRNDGLEQRVGIIQWTVRDDGDHNFLYEATGSVTKEVVGVVAVVGKAGKAKINEWLTVGCYSS